MFNKYCEILQFLPGLLASFINYSFSASALRFIAMLICRVDIGLANRVYRFHLAKFRVLSCILPYTSDLFMSCIFTAHNIKMVPHIDLLRFKLIHTI